MVGVGVRTKDFIKQIITAAFIIEHTSRAKSCSLTPALPHRVEQGKDYIHKISIKKFKGNCDDLAT